MGTIESTIQQYRRLDMGFLSNVAKWFNNSPAQDAFENAKEEWNDKNGDKGIGPYTQARDDWRKRKGQCPGSGTPANFIQRINPRTRLGMCPVCKKNNLSVTNAGKTWPHKRLPAKAPMRSASKKAVREE